MANTATVYARIDPGLKSDVEIILNQLGITPSSLIQMLYSEIKLTKKVPLKLSLPVGKPLSVAKMSKKEFDSELKKGVKDVKKGKVRSMKEMDEILKNGCGI